MKYKNKKTGEIIEPKNYTERFMCERNSNFERYEEVKKKTKKEDETDEVQK